MLLFDIPEILQLLLLILVHPFQLFELQLKHLHLPVLMLNRLGLVCVYNTLYSGDLVYFFIGKDFVFLDVFLFGINNNTKLLLKLGLPFLVLL